MRTKVLLAGILLAIAAVSCAAAEMKWQARTVKFADATTIGGTTVPAGQYKVEHQMNGEEHIMLFTNVGDKKVRAQSKCHMVASPQKEKRTLQAYELIDGQNRLKTLTFKGDTFVHELY